MARGDGTSHPLLGQIWMARRINDQHGGAVMAAWDVDELPDDWLEAFSGLSFLPQRQARQKAIMQAHDKFRREYYSRQ